MDYRKNHPEPPNWDQESFAAQYVIPAYGAGDIFGICEIRPADRSTCFLVCHGWYDEGAGKFFCYGIEAPRACLIRQEFEWGCMSWIDYWCHKGWLLRLVMPFNDGPVSSEYISPTEIDRDTINLFRHYNRRGPYLMKRDQLKIAFVNTSFNGEDPIEAERRYQEFMSQHGHRFTNPAA